MKKIKAYDEFGEQFELGLVPATEEEQQACEEKFKKYRRVARGLCQDGQ